MRQLSTGEAQKVLVTPPSAKVAVWLTRSPQLDLARSKPAVLDLSSPDERIVEEAYAASCAHFAGTLILLSHDSIPLECAHDVGLNAKAIPDAWLLEPEPNEQADQLKKLTDRIVLLEGRAPRLEFGLVGDRNEIVTSMQYFPPLSEDFVSRAIEASARAHPRKVRTFMDNLRGDELYSFVKAMLPSDAQWSHYETEYQEWLSSLDKRLRKIHLLLNATTQGATVDWKMVNSGASSAERLIVDIRPKGPIFFDNFEKGRKVPLGLPKPPSQPTVTFGVSSLGFNAIGRPPLSDLSSILQRDRHEFSWDLTPSKKATLCRGQCEEFRHGLQDARVSLTIRPSNPDGGDVSACVQFLISASNLANTMEAIVPVRIQLDVQNTELTVSDWLMRDLEVRLA
jgi:hypothetical protein